MKKYFLLTAASIVALLILHSDTFAQIKSDKTPIANKSVDFVASEESNRFIDGKSESVNTKAARDFNRRFKLSAAVTWLEAADGYRAKFENDGVTIWVDYDRKGCWTHTIRIYGEQRLPAEIRHIVKSTYYDHSIKTVHEVELPNDDPGNRCYLIRLENEKTFIDLRLYDGEMEVIRQWTKN